MGGRGSGRRQRYARKTTESYLALDLAALGRRGLLQPGCSASITWSRGEMKVEGGSVQLALGERNGRLPRLPHAPSLVFWVARADYREIAPRVDQL
jgi:hypothetical protein